MNKEKQLQEQEQKLFVLSKEAFYRLIFAYIITYMMGSFKIFGSFSIKNVASFQILRRKKFFFFISKIY